MLQNYTKQYCLSEISIGRHEIVWKWIITANSTKSSQKYFKEKTDDKLLSQKSEDKAHWQTSIPASASCYFAQVKTCLIEKRFRFCQNAVHVFVHLSDILKYHILLSQIGFTLQRKFVQDSDLYFPCFVHDK